MHILVDILRLPHFTTTFRDALNPVVDGMIIYNTTTLHVEARQNGSWIDLSALGGAGADILPDLRIQDEDQTVSANKSLAVADEYEIGSGFFLELSDGSVMEIL